MLLHVHALHHRPNGACHRVVARTDALRADSVLALVDASKQACSALCNRRRCIVQVELAEKVGFAVRTVHACPFFKFVDASSVGAVCRDGALEHLSRLMEAVWCSVLA